MKVRYSRRALGDLQEAANYLNPRNPAAAVSVRASIRSAVRRIAQYPQSGRLQEDGSRKAVALTYGYLIYYDIVDAQIEIATIQHPSQERPTEDG